MSWSFLISALCFGVTLTWYYFAEIQFVNREGEEIVAYVSKMSEGAQHRPANISLWQLLEMNDSLYNGEAIRTSTEGEVRIHFKDSEKFIDLEPDSLIVIQKSKGEIALDLMEGSLFVDAKGSAGGNSLVLNSANGKVDLSGASVNLSKGANSGLNVQVLEGKASIKDKNGNSQVLETGKTGLIGTGGVEINTKDIEIISPFINKPNYVYDPKNSEVIFEWKGLPDDAIVSVQTGNSQKSLKDFLVTEAPGIRRIKGNLNPGKYMWKLVAKNPKDGSIMSESPTYKLELKPRFGPVALSPEASSKVLLTEMPGVVSFNWSVPDQIQQIKVEIAKDAEFQQVLVTQNSNKESSYQWKVLEQGTYFWRLTSQFTDSDKVLVSSVLQFSVVHFKKEKEPLIIDWNLAQENNNTQYYINEPALNLQWAAKNRTEEIASWKIKYRSEIDPKQVIEKQTSTLDLKEKIEKPGRYIASIEALDQQGLVLGSTEERTVSILEKPRLESPKILPIEGELKAEKDGRFSVKWDKQDQAKDYLLVVKDSSGKILANKKYPSNSAELKNLLPGKYSVKVLSIDEHGRESLEATERILSVPDVSRVKAPTLKKIKVN